MHKSFRISGRALFPGGPVERTFYRTKGMNTSGSGKRPILLFVPARDATYKRGPNDRLTDATLPPAMGAGKGNALYTYCLAGGLTDLEDGTDP